MSIKIRNVIMSKNEVKTNEQFKIIVQINELVSEPTAYRFPFHLGQPKGNLKGAAYAQKMQEPEMYSLPFNFGDNQGGGFK